MAKKKKKQKLDTVIEWFDRYCPICGKFIAKGSQSHECSDEDLRNLYKEIDENEDDEKEVENEPSFDEKISDGDFLSKIMELDDGNLEDY